MGFQFLSPPSEGQLCLVYPIQYCMTKRILCAVAKTGSTISLMFILLFHFHIYFHGISFPPCPLGGMLSLDYPILYDEGYSVIVV